MADRVYSVSEFNKIVKGYLEENPVLQEFFLKGELSGVNYYRSGHLYFTLKDSKCQVKCAAFSYKYKRIPEDLKEGDSVKIFGDVGFYENRGDFQILVRHIEKEDKIGELYRKLEEVKKSFEEKGYFSPLYKKPLPKYPKSVGVVTSLNGAALHDIINTARKRMKNIDIYVYPAKVQGPGAAEEIVKGIETLDKIDEIDFIVAGRGGGSIEDLWAFNEEKVALAFFNCKKPIISAVGHEIDFLLSDLTADIRAATPTQSMEIAVPVRSDIESMLENKKKYLDSLIKSKIEKSRKELENLENSFALKNFSRYIDDCREEVVSREKELQRALKIFLERKRQELILKTEKIININPLSTLSRGYSITRKNNIILKDTSSLKEGDEITTNLYNGTVISTVKEIK
ncbi:exodeoxyribonuclease VII large subunit [Fusobacterium perfoetens]|uniref:exodeoxyribonuclease VII large subunit n=1 Tax=Fusobacterium perfoetens TaxID=852 RepID=UPI001F254194|nr:exodeoxyribonuclease VII large subunit [Fusobacterium perfoetens]MCF2624860.1 exodeoxyribonuclease VII large subunit [Fusobacterium perfoetens]